MMKYCGIDFQTSMPSKLLRALSTTFYSTYIKQLIKETNDEIEDLTNEIEDEIEVT